MKNRATNKRLSFVMAAAVLVTLPPGVTVYAVDSGEPPLDASGIITAFGPLPREGSIPEEQVRRTLAETYEREM